MIRRNIPIITCKKSNVKLVICKQVEIGIAKIEAKINPNTPK